MKEKVLSLAKGNFIYKAPELVLTPDKLEMQVVAGECTTETFVLENQRGTKMKGFGSAEAPELNFLPVFHAEKNELKLEVNARELVPGECLKGEIHLVTECGEAELPYEIRIVSPELEDEKGTVHDYHALREGIQENPENGAALFHNPNFEEVFLYRDEAGKILYHHLIHKNTKLQSMEEFLAAMGKKKAIRFDMEHVPSGQTKEIEYELQGTDIQDSLKIRINTWGSTGIRVRSTADFIEPGLHVLWTDDFAGGKDILEYTIRADKVRAGRQTGSLILESLYERKEIRITVHNVLGATARKVKRARKAALASLYRTYLSYHEERIEKAEFQAMLRKNQAVIEKISPDYQLPVMGYIPVILRDQKEILDFYQETEPIPVPTLDADIKEIENYILIEYIKYLYTKREEDRVQVSRLLEGYRDNGTNSILLFWLRLHVDERYRSLRLKEEDIREQLEQGWNSPLLYSEMMKCFQKDPSLITTLSRVTLSTVSYGLKVGMITEEIAVAISFLAERVPKFEPVVFDILEKLYLRFHMVDTLRSICSLLIRNEMRDRKYFPWFAKGVEEHLRLTDLYEYFMYTMDYSTTFTLPDSVISYFQYENHLNSHCKAFLYAYIVKKKKEQPENFRLYGTPIREFALQQLGRHRISEDIGVIYEGLFKEGNIRDSVAKNLPYVMFTELLTCYDDQMESVVVVHTEMKEEVTYQLDGGQALIQIYTPNVQLFFVDRNGYYYSGTIDYSRQKLLHLDKFARACYENGSDHIGLLAHLAVKAMRGARLEAGQAAILHKAANVGCFRDYTNGKLLLRLYDYYKEKKETALLLEVLDAISPERIKRERLGEVATDCIYHGMYDKAEKMLTRYGIQGCEKKALAMLILEKVQERGGEFVPKLVKWAVYLYQEHYYEQGTLHYLLQYYMGRTETLTSIYKKCLEIPEIIIEDGAKERLLGQVLFTGTNPAPYERLFLEYYENGSNRVLVKAFLSAYAYDYLVGKIELSEEVFVKIEKEAFYEKEKVMVLATLKYYSNARSFAKKQQEFIELNLERYASEGLVLAFMKEFIGKTAVPYEIENTVLIQYTSGTDKGVYLYVSTPEGKYEAEPMKQVFDGIYTKELLLFEGEEKNCYIYEEESGERTAEMVVRRPENSGGSPGFFQMVNQMIEAKNKGDMEMYEQLRGQYERERGVAAKLFKIQ